ncbi:MAG TPA: FecR family protein [Patescibacteria group bacterium]|nr:FecR family protein [Patescibacteria group bacterium]
MAIQPPPAPVVPQQATPPTTPRRSGCFGRGCGCGGCLLTLLLIVVLAVGGSYWFFIVQASAAVSAPATLVVINQPVTVNGNPSIPGQALNAGDTVQTGTTGHASIQFPDGSFLRLSPSTTVSVTAVQLQKTGGLQSASILQRVGRTFASVQHLASGATFTVSGHSVSASVRGTQFETLVKPDGTNKIWVFDGTVWVAGKTTVKLTAGQEIDSDANGDLGAVRSSQFDITDSFPLVAQCTSAASDGSNSGTMKTWAGDSLTAGRSDESTYYSPGGTLTVVLCYPGSLMRLTVIDPVGHQLMRQAASPAKIAIPLGAPGLYRAIVTAITVAPTGEAYAITFANETGCVAGDIDTGSAVRKTLSNSQIADDLAKAGASGVTVQVAGTSPTSARIVYYSTAGGLPIEWSADLYAATPNIGAVITEVSVRGIYVTTAVISRLSSIGGISIAAIPSDFIVDRVYSCSGPDGDGMLVIEGHR